MAALPGVCAPQKKTPHRQRSGVAATEGATRKATGDPATHAGAGDPACETEQCVGYGQSAPEEGTCPGDRCGSPRTCGLGS